MDKQIKGDAVKALDDAQQLITVQRDTLQAEFDDMSEKQQESEKGEALQLALEQLELASDATETALATIRDL